MLHHRGDELGAARDEDRGRSGPEPLAEQANLVLHPDEAALRGGGLGEDEAADASCVPGKRVRLRSVRAADLADIVDISVYDGVRATNEAEALATLRRIEADAQRGDAVHWGICLAGHDTVVGTIGLYRGFSDATGEVGYVMQAPYRRRGLMREALLRFELRPDGRRSGERRDA